MPTRRWTRLLLSLTLITSAVFATAPLTYADEGPLNTAFRQAADRFAVPRDLLVAIAYAESHFDDHGGRPSVDNGYGLMHLTDNPSSQTLARAATLLGVDADRLKSDSAENILGGAAILSGLADRQHLSAEDRRDPGAWYSAVAAYSQASDPTVARGYADEVFQLMSDGVAGSSPAGELVTVAPQVVVPQVAQFQAAAPPASSGDLAYPATNWVPAASDNFDQAQRPADDQIDFIIIHVTEGSYTSAINWFQDPTAHVSAHYVIRSSDGQITQMVHLKDIAWHAGNSDYNAHSIGIEHEGYTEDGSWFSDVMYRTSAALVRALCLKYHIPMDRQHIIGHSEVPDPNNPNLFGGANHHEDPGPYWNWDYYMRLVNSTPAQPVAPLSSATFFGATGHNLGPLFGSYWSANGGLPVFGYPRTDSFPEQNPDTGQVYTVQYFERQRYELHPENAGTPYYVELGRLGQSDAQNRGLLGSGPFMPLPPPSGTNSACGYFPETHHYLCSAFRAYWHSHGLDFGDPGFSYRESLALFGYAISEEFTDPATGLTVQYFERAVFEYHPEFAGTPYEVELRLLGNQVLQQRGWLP